jgi:hypothetical protein
MRKEVSRLIHVNQRSKGLRVNIPTRIVQEMGFQVADLIEWEIFDKKGKKSVCISRV